MESEGSSDVYDPATLDTEEGFDSVETREENDARPGSFRIAMELSHNIHGNRSSHDVRIDLEAGGEPVNPDQAPNDEISDEVPADGALDDESSEEIPDGEAQDDMAPDEQIQQHVPFSVTITVDVPQDGQMPVVPPHVRKVDLMSYTPKLVSIGPIHHNRKSLRLTKAEKMRFLGPFLDDRNKESLRSVMENWEARVRRCYSMTFQGISSVDFVDMLLTDGCFIVALFRRNYKWSKEGVDATDNPIFSTRWMLPEIGRDLLMIENQLPLFVLKEIFNVTKLMPNETSFEQVALEFFKSFHIGKEAMVIKKHHTEGHHEHLLDLFHSLYLPPKSSDSGAAQERRENKEPLMYRPSVQGKNWVPSATVLKSSGVRFYAMESNSLEIQFRVGTLGGRLSIPSISIDESSIIILKNLLAYEQSSRGIEPLFTSLVLFFSSMASVPDDIKLLREASIIRHQPGDDQMLIEVLKLLSKQLECDVRDCSMKQQVEDIIAFCGCNIDNFWYAGGRILAKNAVRFILLCLSLVLAFTVGRYHHR
ncbi:UPF0481 protein At3g47200-like [Coffea eugenioides]|uniref:UPF0481 protein At3g47200-like n=1 Tax=Coffea eugenioides TaxID=49369 RepID=UPI000F609868|nr:UPF0481 protein At3g47200-like [Coffea eugenioides]